MLKKLNMNYKKITGFTIIELVVVITIIGILSTIGVLSYTKIQANARDSERSAKITTVAEALEKYYSQNGEYPTCTDITKDSTTVVSDTLVDMDQNALTTPESTAGTNSFVCSDPSSNSFGYVGGGGQYTLEYISENTSQIVSLDSRHRVTIAVPASPTITRSTSGNSTTWSWSAATCIDSTARYQYRLTTNHSYDSGLIATANPTVTLATADAGYVYTFTAQAECYTGTNASGMSTAGTSVYTKPTVAIYTLTLNYTGGGSVSGADTYISGETATITATPSTNYYFGSWSGSTGCSGLASHTITIDSDKTCTASFVATAIAVPSAPTVSASTSGSTTTWSWGVATCTGNTARYQYRYTTSYGYDSGLIATAGTSIGFTTSSEGYTYTVSVQAECYNAATASGMSTTGTASYYRPASVTYYTLSLSKWGGDGWIWCGSENGVCTYGGNFGGSGPVRFGANSSWATTYYGAPSSQTTVSCTTANFGDPAPGVTKACYFQGNSSVSGAGTYVSGTSVTITAYPVGYFIEWTGDAGCSGSYSHTIIMDSNKTCTAGFNG